MSYSVPNRAVYYRLQQLLPVLQRLEEQAVAGRRDQLQAPIIARTARRIRTLFRTQEREFLRRMDTQARQMGLSESARLRENALPDWERHWTQTELATLLAFIRALEQAYDAALMAGALEVLAQLKVSIAFDLENPRALAYAHNRAATQVTRINEATRQALRRVITDGIREGQSYSQIAQRIRERFREMRTPWPQKHIRDRAEAIAIYEVGDAYEAGNQAAAEELAAWGATMEKAWITVGDERVRPEHRANEAAGWIGLDARFPSGHMRPPTDPGCRCTTIYRQRPGNEGQGLP